MKSISTRYATTNVSRRIPMPENIGMPIRLCETPTVNGFTTPAAKPKHAASMEMPKPTSASQPNTYSKELPRALRV